MSWMDDARAAISDPAFAGVAGSILSLKWAPGEEWTTRIVSFLVGLGFSIWGTQALIEALSIKWTNAQSLFAFLLGMLSMNLLAKLIDFIKTTSLADLIATWRGGAK